MKVLLSLVFAYAIFSSVFGQQDPEEPLSPEETYQLAKHYFDFYNHIDNSHPVHWTDYRCEDDRPVYFPDNYSCRHFVKCLSGEVTRHVCPDKMFYDYKLEMCIIDVQKICWVEIK